MRGSRLTVEPLGGGSTSFIVRAPPSSPLVPTGLSAAAAAAAISAVFLAESVRFDRCYFYFACLLHSKDGHGEAPQMVVPFPHLLPPLADLQRVHDGVWDALRRGAECTYDES